MRAVAGDTSGAAATSLFEVSEGSDETLESPWPRAQGVNAREEERPFATTRTTSRVGFVVDRACAMRRATTFGRVRSTGATRASERVEDTDMVAIENRGERVPQGCGDGARKEVTVRGSRRGPRGPESLVSAVEL